MRYFVSFFLISFILFLIQSLNASPDSVETVQDTRDAIDPSLENQVRFIEGPNYLFDSIKTHKFFSQSLTTKSSFISSRLRVKSPMGVSLNSSSKG